MKPIRYLLLLASFFAATNMSPFLAKQNEEPKEGFGTFCKLFLVSFAVHATAQILCKPLVKNSGIFGPIVGIGALLFAREWTNKFHQDITDVPYPYTHLVAGLWGWSSSLASGQSTEPTVKPLTQ